MCRDASFHKPSPPHQLGVRQQVGIGRYDSVRAYGWTRRRDGVAACRPHAWYAACRLPANAGISASIAAVHHITSATGQAFHIVCRFFYERPSSWCAGPLAIAKSDQQPRPVQPTESKPLSTLRRSRARPLGQPARCPPAEYSQPSRHTCPSEEKF